MSTTTTEPATSERSAPRRFRRYVLVALGFALAAVIGVASAQWVTIPTGHGKGYAKGQSATQGIAVTVVGYDSTLGVSTIGPNQTGTLTVGLQNDNLSAVTVTKIAPTPGGKIVAKDDPTCTASSPADFTLSTWTGSQPLALSNAQHSTGNVPVTLTTTGTLPACLADAVFSIPVDVDATAS